MTTTGVARDSSLDRVYDFITRDEEGRTCEAIPQEACTDVPRNFILNVLNGTCTKLAEQIASPGLVYPWFLAALGAPTALAGLLVPIRRAGSLLPQLVVSGQIRSFQRRKWFWSGAGTTQAVALGLTVLAAVTLGPVAAGVAAVVLLALFSMASGVGSVAFTDVMGKTIPQGRRGRLLAARATTGGGLAVFAGLLLRRYVAEESSIMPYLILLAAAAVLWFVAAIFFAGIEEVPGATGGGRNPLKEAQVGLQIMREVPGFRRFIVARGFLLTVELAIPFYALHGRQLVSGELSNLGAFVVASALAAVLSSPFWGRFADQSSRTVMALGGSVAVITAAYALLFSSFPAEWQTGFAYAPVFLLFGFAKAGVRLGRKTFLVDAAPADERPLWVAWSNTLIGILTLIGGGFGLIAQAFGVQVLIALLAVLAACGVLVSWRLPEASEIVPA